MVMTLSMASLRCWQIRARLLNSEATNLPFSQNQHNLFHKSFTTPSISATSPLPMIVIVGDETGEGCLDPRQL